MDDFYQANINLWNEWTEIHKDSAAYDLDGFLKGDSRLHSIEVEELGDVAGKSLLHLQCHFGLDTLSWARRGAVVTGVDFSDKAIALAQAVAKQAGLEARFIRSNLFDLPTVLDEQFDIVYTSYGVLMWLHDIPAWGRLVARCLKQGGTFYIVEFHPFMNILEENAEHNDLNIVYPYFPRREPQAFAVDGSYADRNAKVNQPVEYEWPHSLGEIVSSLIAAGLRIEFLHEFPVTVDSSNIPNLTEPLDGGYYRLKVHADSLPLMFSIRATRE